MSPTAIRSPWSALLASILLAGSAATLLAACVSSTQLNAQWLNPNAGASLPVRSVMILGIARDTTSRRLYEDAMVNALSARGVKAVQSYMRLPGDGPAPQAMVERAVKEAGVDSVLMTQLIAVTNETVISPGFVGPGPIGWGGFYGAYSGMWGASFATAPSVQTFQNISIDTRLFDVREQKVLWSGATTTTPTSNSMQRTITEFVEVLVNAMTASKVI